MSVSYVCMYVCAGMYVCMCKLTLWSYSSTVALHLCQWPTLSASVQIQDLLLTRLISGAKGKKFPPSNVDSNTKIIVVGFCFTSHLWFYWKQHMKEQRGKRTMQLVRQYPWEFFLFSGSPLPDIRVVLQLPNIYICTIRGAAVGDWSLATSAGSSYSLRVSGELLEHYHHSYIILIYTLHIRKICGQQLFCPTWTY